MELYFLTLAINLLLKTVELSPVARPDWNPSRYIIHNRTDFLLNKPFSDVYYKAISIESENINDSETLNGEKSAYQDHYTKYDGDLLQGPPWKKLDNDLGTTGNGYNAKDPTKRRNETLTVQNGSSHLAKESQGLNNLESPKVDKASHHVKGRYDEIIWTSKQKENDLVPPTGGSMPEVPDPATPKPSSLQTPSTNPPFLWNLSEGNLLEENSEPKERHVYETRIETVSYHQEIIFNSPTIQRYRYEESDTGNYNSNEQSNGTWSVNDYKGLENQYEKQEDTSNTSEENDRNDTMGRLASTNSAGSTNQNKFGYVVEGKNYRKYRVEERTVDGFIVGEYGVVSHDDGSLRGVRYTADESHANPQLIYEALMKFLSL